jgi:hypothetical protein
MNDADNYSPITSSLSGSAANVKTHLSYRRERFIPSKTGNLFQNVANKQNKPRLSLFLVMGFLRLKYRVMLCMM